MCKSTSWECAANAGVTKQFSHGFCRQQAAYSWLTHMSALNAGCEKQHRSVSHGVQKKSSGNTKIQDLSAFQEKWLRWFRHISTAPVVHGVGIRLSEKIGKLKLHTFFKDLLFCALCVLRNALIDNNSSINGCQIPFLRFSRRHLGVITGILYKLYLIRAHFLEKYEILSIVVRGSRLTFSVFTAVGLIKICHK